MEIPAVNTFGDRRLERAGKHVSRLWFPINLSLLRRIRESLVAGSYDLDVEFLLNEVKTDFALFTYCLREVMRLIQDEEASAPRVANPMELLRWAGITRLKTVLLRDESAISVHDLEKMNEAQAQRLKEAMLSASTAEVLGDKDSVGGEFGFTVGLLRQLGLTLIAWNYPTVYRRVFSALKPDRTIDDELTEVLGFSPTLLAISLAREWGLSMEVRSAMGESAGAGDPESSAVGETLLRICKVGEALARANDPEHYPNAANDWEFARKEIETRFGYEGLRIIQEKVRQNCESYATVLPGPFQTLVNLDPEGQIHGFTEEALFRENAHVRSCPPHIRKKLKELYSKLVPNAIQREHIGFLVKEVIPFAGFTGGCVYVLEPGSMLLEPRVKIGKAELRELKSLPSRAEPAYSCTAPIVEHGTSQEGTALVSISAPLGDQHRAGVVYLELLNTTLADEEVNAISVFKAIRQALMDCLHLA